MRKILFIINPISGGIDKQNFRNKIASWCERNVEFKFFNTTGENDQQKIIAELNDYEASTVVACGGDGTVNLVAQSILTHDIKLGIIPLGSANGLATELEIPEDEKEALKIVLADKTQEVDVLKINDRHLCLHLSDIGLNAKLIKRFEKGSTRGKLGYARHFFETLFNKKALEYSFESEEEANFQEKAEMVVFANAKKYGTGAVVNPVGKLGDGKFEVCIFKPYPWYAIFRLTYLFFSGNLNYSPFVKIFSTTKVKLSSDKAEYLQIDGEPIGEFDNVEVEILPYQLSVLVK